MNPIDLQRKWRELLLNFKFVSVFLIQVLTLSVDSSARPNVLIFLADDAGWGDYSASGNIHLETPNIDSIKQDGVSLEKFYVTPICSPTRAEFLTGRYHPRTGVNGATLGQERVNLDERTIGDSFKQAGYATGLFGKWHNGSQWPYHPNARGFEKFVGHTEGHWGEYFDPILEDNGTFGRTDGYIVDICTDKAIEFIATRRDEPFFCVIPFTTPHSPWAVPNRFWEKFRDMKITQRETQPDMQLTDYSQYDDWTRCVLAMMENQDWNVGRVLRALDDGQLARNTIVIYFTDNGPNSPRWNGGMKGRKGSLDEGGVRSPCFIRWPAQLLSSLKVSKITGVIDLFPTLIKLAGIERVGEKRFDGMDISPLLTQKDSEWQDRLIFSFLRGSVSVRSETHRLGANGQLYNMISDPGQRWPVNLQATTTATELKAAAAAARLDVYGTSQPRLPKPTDMDSRPFGVGYREWPRTWLPARDGIPSGGVRRSSTAPNSSYFVNWRNTQDTISWSIEVVSSGDYDVIVHYTCPIQDTGSIVEVRFLDEARTFQVSPGWDPPLFDNQDTVPRKPGESQLKPFKDLDAGTLRMTQGRGNLTFRALKVPGSSVMDMRAITLIRRR